MTDFLLALRVTADGKLAVQGLKDVDGSIRNVGNAAKETAGKQESLTGAVAKGTVAADLLRQAWDKGVETFKEVVARTNEAQLSHARLEAVLRATNGASGQTAKTVEKLADEMARLTVFDDEAIRNAATTLATFDQIGGKAFERIIRLSADLAATGRGDLQTWVAVLAKAGTEPAEALGLLERALGKFSPALKMAIQDAADFGDKQRAITLLLDEVKSRVGGTAEGTYAGLNRQLGGTKKAYDDLMKAAGAKIFDAESKEASVFENVLRALTSTINDNRTALERLRSAAEGFASGGVFGVLFQSAADAQQAAGRAGPGAPNFAKGKIVPAPQSTPPEPPKGDLITQRQRQALREQDLRLEQDYLNEVYKQRAAEQQRELALEEFRHAAGLAGEREFIDRKAAIAAEGARDEIARLQGQVALERQIQSGNFAELGRARKTEKPDEIVAAEQKVQQSREKINALTLQLAEAEKKLGDVRTKAGREVTLYEKQLLEYRTSVARETEDFARGLQSETGDMQLQLDLIGQTEVVQAKANNERRIRLQLNEKILAVEREIEDITKKDNDPEKIALRRKQIKDLLQEAQDQIDAQGGLIERSFDKDNAKRISDNIADAIVEGGPDMGKKLYDLIAAEFKKPIKVAISALIQGGVQSILGAFGLNPSQLANNPTMGLVAGGGALLGGFGAGALGAGQRGREVGSIVGMLFGGLPGAIAGYFTDPHGNANRTASVGTNPSGTYSYSGRSAFGTFGTFNDRWFSDADMGEQLRQYFATQASAENVLAGRMSSAERARAAAALGGSREYSFGTEHGTVEGLGQISRDRFAAIVEAVLPGLGKLVEGFQGTGEALGKFVESIFGLRDAMTDIDTAIAQLAEGSASAVRAQIDAMNRQVERAQGDLSAALEAKDPTAILQAEQQLSTAVMNRYTTELGMVRQLQDAIAQLKDQAYQFQMTVAQRINAVGGSRDLGAISLNRAGSLRAGIGGDANLPGQIRDLNSYMGAIDNWYNARRAEIEQQMAADQAAQQAIAQAQQAAAQARIAQLQGELDLAKAFESVVERTRQMIDEMRLTATNPLSVSGRLGLATSNAEALRGAYDAASGSGKVDAAGRYLDALQARLGLAQEAFQRPSAEYQAVYNEIVSELTRVQGDARSVSEKSLDLQKSIERLQQQANGYAAISAGASTASSGYLDQLNSEALGYYTWAEAEGERLYKEEERRHQEQLDAITGGMDAELYIAARQRETVDLLTQIRDNIAGFLGNAASAPAAPSTSTNGSSDTPAAAAPRDVSITINAGGGVSTSQVVEAVQKAAPLIKRALAHA